jgi:hypothetical protein
MDSEMKIRGMRRENYLILLKELKLHRIIGNTQKTGQ